MRKPLILFWLFFAAFGWQTVSAQYRFDSWTTDNGLPQNGVRAMTQTPDGYLWFTTFDGLVRFDGVKFTVFDKSSSSGIINNRFMVVRAFADGSIWAATERGDLTVYREGDFRSFPMEIVPDTQIYNFVPDSEGAILIETDKAFYKLINGEFVFVREDENDGTSKLIYHGQSGARWEIYPGQVLRMKDGSTQVYKLKVENVGYYNANAYEDKAGGLWIGDLNRLIYLRDGNISEYGADVGYPKGTFVHRAWEGEDGEIWLAAGSFDTGGVGLIRFKNGEFKIFGTEEGMSDRHIFDAFRDREGTLWLSTDKGLNRMRRQIITPLSGADGLIDNEVYPILQAKDGSIYIGTANGLSHFKDGRFSEVALTFDAPLRTNANVQSLREDADGRLWVGVVGGLFVVENGKARSLDEILSGKSTVSAILPDRHGNIWLGTNIDGVVQYRDGKMIAKYTTENGLAGNDVKVIHESKDGSLWFGTYGGLSVLSPGFDRNTPPENRSKAELKTFTTEDGLASDTVRSIYEDADGTLWIGTYDGGLSRFKDGKFFNFNTENGLFSNGVFAVVEDERGNFWMSSNKGIYRVAKRSLNDFADGRIDHYESFAYGKEDGMLSTECNGGRQPSASKRQRRENLVSDARRCGDR